MDLHQIIVGVGYAECSQGGGKAGGNFPPCNLALGHLVTFPPLNLAPGHPATLLHCTWLLGHLAPWQSLL